MDTNLNLVTENKDLSNEKTQRQGSRCAHSRKKLQNAVIHRFLFSQKENNTKVHIYLFLFYWIPTALS